MNNHCQQRSCHPLASCYTSANRKQYAKRTVSCKPILLLPANHNQNDPYIPRIPHLQKASYSIINSCSRLAIRSFLRQASPSTVSLMLMLFCCLSSTASYSAKNSVPGIPFHQVISSYGINSGVDVRSNRRIAGTLIVKEKGREGWNAVARQSKKRSRKEVKRARARKLTSTCLIEVLVRS